MNFKTCFLSLALLTGACTLSNAQSKLFTKYAEKKDVSRTSISSLLLNLLPSTKAGGFDSKKIVSKIESAEVITTTKKSLAKKMTKEAAKFATNKEYSPLLDTGKDTLVPSAYMKKEGNQIKEIVTYYTEGESFYLVKLNTKDLTEDDLKTLTKKEAN